MSLTHAKGEHELTVARDAPHFIACSPFHPPLHSIAPLSSNILPYLPSQSASSSPAVPAAMSDPSSAPAAAGPSVSAKTKEAADVQDDGENRGRSSESAQPRARKKRLGVDLSLILSEQRSKRRKTPTPEPEQQKGQEANDPKDAERAKTLGMQIYQKIMDANDTE